MCELGSQTHLNKHLWGGGSEGSKQIRHTVRAAHRQHSVLQGWHSALSCQPRSIPSAGYRRPPSVQPAPRFSPSLPLHLLSHGKPQSSPVLPALMHPARQKSCHRNSSLLASLSCCLTVCSLSALKMPCGN